MRAFLCIMLVCVMLVSTGCGTVMVAGKRFGYAPVDVRAFVTPDKVRLYGSIDAAWAALETGYIYRPDEWYISDKNGQAISGGKDTWLLPVETQVLVNSTLRAMDCEDGAAWLASALKKQGYDAWLCVGTITVEGQVYGHAWTMVLQSGAWTTYETTIGEVSPGMPGIYNLSWRTNGVQTWRNAMMTGTDLTIDPLPPDLLTQLRQEFAES